MHMQRPNLLMPEFRNGQMFLALLLCGVVFVMSRSPGVMAQNETEPKTSEKAEQPAEPTLPKRGDMLRNIPSKADLLTKQPTDWIFLKNDDVLVVRPISPRPRTLEIYADKRKEFSKPPVLKRNTGESNDDFTARQRASGEEARKQREKYEQLEVELPETVKLAEEQEASSYKLHIEKFVSEVLHHEDLTLKRIDLLLEQKNLEDSYELLLFLDRTAAGWPGYNERLNRFLLLDAQSKLAAGELEPAFAILEQMHSQIKEAINAKDTSNRYVTIGKDLESCQAELGKVIDALIEPAMKARDFRQARFHLARLVRIEPEHPRVAPWRDRMVTETNAVLAQAAQAATAGQHDKATVLADEAALVWPTTPNLKNTHRIYAQRWQALKSGVIEAAASRYPFPTEASRRRDGLTRVPLFETARVDGGARYRSRFLENWEPTDLGRQAVFSLRPNRSSWESTPLVTASGAVSSLLQRLNPDSPQFDERLASFIDGVEVRGPFEFAVKFSRIPVRTEALFSFPLGWDELSSTELDQRFKVHSTNGSNTSIRRAIPEGDKVLQRHLAEIVEVGYPSYDRAVQGLLRGEVSMLPNVPIWQLEGLQKDGRVFVRKFAVPQTHVIQFHPKSKALRSSELRRALTYSLDRSQILREVMLRDLTVRTLSEPLPKASVPAKMPAAETGFTYDSAKSMLVWSGLSMSDGQYRYFSGLSQDTEYRKILQTLFRKSQPGGGRVVSAPWATTLSAYNPTVVPREADVPLAFALATAAKRGLGGEIPKLRMICEPDPTIEAAAKRLIEEWKKVDIKVELVSMSPPAQAAKPDGAEQVGDGCNQDVNAAPANAAAAEQPEWDLVYRTLRSTEPMMELWPLLSLDTVARLQSIRYLPDWLRQSFIDLDRTADWATTVASMQELHKQIAETAQVLPLWELDDAVVFRKTIRGFPDAPLHPYHDVELWISEPWYSTE